MYFTVKPSLNTLYETNTSSYGPLCVPCKKDSRHERANPLGRTSDRTRLGIFISNIADKDNPDWKTIKEIVSVLQKLIQNYQQLQMLSKQQSLGEADQRDLMLSEDTIRDIEEQLNLL